MGIVDRLLRCYIRLEYVLKTWIDAASMSSFGSDFDMVDILDGAIWLHKTFAKEPSSTQGSPGRAVKYARFTEPLIERLGCLQGVGVVIVLALLFMAAKLQWFDSNNGN